MSLTSYITYIFAADTSSTTGAGKTGLAYSDFTIKQLIPGGTLASLTTENITTLGTFASPTSAAHIRIKEVNSADPTKGWYEVQIHDTNMAWANRELMLGFSASGASIKPLRIDLQTPTITQDDSGSVLLAVSQPSTNFAELHVTGAMTADSFAIANNLQIDGTFSTAAFTINGVAPGAPSGLAVVGSAMTLTSAYDPAKTAAQAGDAMTLTAAYDAAKTAATQTSVNLIKTTTDLLATGWTVVDGNIVFTTASLANAPSAGGTPLDVTAEVIFTEGTST